MRGPRTGTSPPGCGGAATTRPPESGGSARSSTSCSRRRLTSGGVRRSPELARRWRPRVLQSHQRLGDVDPNVAAVRVRLLALGLLVAGGTLWVALALPTTHCVRVAADATDCSSWSLIKY